MTKELSTSQKMFNEAMLRALGDLIKNRLPLPLPEKSKEAKVALKRAKEGIRLDSQGRLKIAIINMIEALYMGVPEPLNYQIRKSLFVLIDKQIKLNIQMNRENQGPPNTFVFSN